jgi:hypothetical protein
MKQILSYDEYLFEKVDRNSDVDETYFKLKKDDKEYLL